MAERNHGVYATHSLRELYDQLMAGRSESVHNQAAALQRLHDTVDHLSSTLARDLQELGQVWRGSSGQEYARRVGLIVSYSGQLATDFSRLHTALTNMAADLHDAQGKAENPAHVEGNSHMIDDAIAGGVALGPLGVVVGGLWGHHQDDEAKQQAKDRMVALVAKLAGDYEMNQATWPQAPLPPDGMPDDGSGGHAAPAGGPGGAGARRYGGPPGGHGAEGRNPTQADAATLTPVSQVGQVDSSTSLLSAGGALIGSGVLSGAALDALRGGAATPGSADDEPGVRGRAANGVIGADEDGPQHGSGSAGARGGRPAQGGGTGDTEQAGRANRAALGSGNGNRAGMATRGGTGEDEPDEHLTWLVEDEMVWGGDEATPPPVLGGEPPASVTTE